MPTVLRIIVGASGSPSSLRALRYAQHLARDYDATLMPVLAWLPPCGDLADRRTPNEELRRIWAQDAHQRLQDTLNLAWGTPPADLPVWPLVRRGHPGPVLADAACRPGDLLVVGAGRRGALARMAGGRVSRYCLAYAQCPVLALPPPLAHAAPRGVLAAAMALGPSAPPLAPRYPSLTPPTRPATRPATTPAHQPPAPADSNRSHHRRSS